MKRRYTGPTGALRYGDAELVQGEEYDLPGPVVKRYAAFFAKPKPQPKPQPKPKAAQPKPKPAAGKEG
jgi:hypothetical protein